MTRNGKTSDNVNVLNQVGESQRGSGEAEMVLLYRRGRAGHVRHVLEEMNANTDKPLARHFTLQCKVWRGHGLGPFIPTAGPHEAAHFGDSDQ